MIRLLTLLFSLALLQPTTSLARTTGGHGRHSHSTHHSLLRSNHTRPSTHRNRAAGVKRDKHGRIARSQTAKNSFKKQHPCPSTGKSGGACPGYVIDHIKPLKRGGADAPSNMQWQTKDAAKAKDKWE